MAKLTEEQKAFIVCGYATFLTGYQIMIAFTERFGITIDRKQVHAYRPDKTRHPYEDKGRQKWLKLYEHTRAEFLASASAVPIANGVYRLTQLQRMFEEAAAIDGKPGRKANIPLAASLLEQAAKEAGGSFTNKADITVKDKRAPAEEHTIDDKRTMLAERLAAAAERLAPAPGARTH